jgi:hypothetical protein
MAGIRQLFQAALKATDKSRLRAPWFVGGALALSVAALSMAFAAARPAPSPQGTDSPLDTTPTAETPERPCPLGTLPDSGVCIPTPATSKLDPKGPLDPPLESATTGAPEPSANTKEAPGQLNQ